MTTDLRHKDSPQRRNIPVNLDRYDNTTLKHTKDTRLIEDVTWRTSRQEKGMSSNRGDMANQRLKSAWNTVPVPLQAGERSTRCMRGGGDRDISCDDAGRVDSSFSMVHKPNITTFETRSGATDKSTSPRLPDGCTRIALPASVMTHKSQLMTKRPTFLKLNEKVSDASSSIISTKSASSGSRASGDCPCDLTSHMRITSKPRGAAHVTSPRNLTQGLNLPAVRSRAQIQVRRSSSEPAINFNSSITSHLPADQPPIPDQCLPGQTHRNIPLVRSLERRDRSWARLERTKSHPQVTSRTMYGNRNRKKQEKSSNEQEMMEERDGKGDDEETNEDLDRKVLTWLDGLDSATCRRFMRRQMASLQEVDDH